MSLRGNQSYARMARDCYFTPEAGIRPLLRHLPVEMMRRHQVWECAAGDGFLAMHLARAGLSVTALDVAPVAQQYFPVAQGDFLEQRFEGARRPLSFITNPPYGEASRLIIAFLHHAMAHAGVTRGLVAMLLPFEFDTRASRDALVGGHPCFAAKITCGERLRWRNLPPKDIEPKAHHSWFIWAFEPALRAAIRAQGAMRVA